MQAHLFIFTIYSFTIYNWVTGFFCFKKLIIQSIITSPHYHITTSSHYHINTSSHHHIITSPNHHIITSSHHHIITSTHQHINTSSHHHIITSSHHHIITLSHQHINTSIHQLFFLITIRTAYCTRTSANSSISHCSFHIKRNEFVVYKLPNIFIQQISIGFKDSKSFICQYL